MKTLRDNIPRSKAPKINVGKIGFRSLPIVIAMLAMYCGKKTNEILYNTENTPITISAIDSAGATEADVRAGWNEARPDQILLSYCIRKGDTLSAIARKHHITLESILSINKKITSPDTIQVGQIILIPFDGSEESGEDTTEQPSPHAQTALQFTQASLESIMKKVLIKPRGTMIGAIGDQPSDTDRLEVIAGKTGLAPTVPEVRYANLCAANMRAVSASLQEYLQDQGTSVKFSWVKGKNGIGVGEYFASLKANGTLPSGFEVIQTKQNPDANKLKQILLEKGKEYSIFILSYSHEADGHVNMAFRVGNDLIIFDPSWVGKSQGWPERFHKFEDYMNHFTNGKTTPGYTEAKDRYNLYNVTCVPTYKISPLDHFVEEKRKLASSESTTENDIGGNLSMVFEGFSPRRHIDTQKDGITTYSIGHGTNMGTQLAQYPYGTYAKDIVNFLESKNHKPDAIKAIMLGEKDITRAEAQGLFELRYVPRYQKIRAHCGDDWKKYPPVIRNMLVDMSYNLNGEYGIFPNGSNYPGFPDAVKALNNADWVGFIDAVADSKYAREDVGPRRVGAWFSFIVRDLLDNNSQGLSLEAKHILEAYTLHYEKDMKKLIAKAY